MRIAILLLISIEVGSSSAQFTFPSENARWTQAITFYSTGEWPPQTYGTIHESFDVNGSDTLIGGRYYSQMIYHDGSYFAGVRDSAGKVMVMPPGETTEELLYDFTLPIGVDTLIEFWAGGTTSAVMRSQGPTGPDGRIIIECVGSFYSWIEGVGCTAGPFIPPYVNISGSSSELICMSYNDSIRYPETVPGICDLATSVPINERAMIEVYPNPVIDVLYLRSPKIKAGDRYVLHSADGRSVLCGILADTERNEISLEALAPGLYVLVLQGFVPRSILKE